MSVGSTFKRCAWPSTELDIAYHDSEWGVPVHDDNRLFEFLILEGAQAGLSWETILRKRDNYRAAFDRFNPKKVAKYDERKVAALSRYESQQHRRYSDPEYVWNLARTHGVNVNREYAEVFEVYRVVA